MDITPLIPEHKNTITSYGNHSFVLNTKDNYTSHLIVTAEQTIIWTIPEKLSYISLEHITPLMELTPKPDIVLLGTGNITIPLTAEARKKAASHHITIDIMTTGAACRTYNVLLAEERNIAAALILV